MKTFILGALVLLAPVMAFAGESANYEMIQWAAKSSTADVLSREVLEDRCFRYLENFCQTSAPYRHARDGQTCASKTVTSENSRTLPDGRIYWMISCESTCCGEKIGTSY